jgi:hypothetical protein
VTRPTDWDAVFGISDPTPGDPWSIRGMQRSWSDLADDAEHAESKVRQLLGDEAISGWIGEGGNAFRDKTYDLPDQLGKCHRSYRLAADALSTWATRLETHQAAADRALVQGRDAQADLHAANATLTSASGSDVLAFLERYADTPPPASVTPPSEEAIRNARARLSSAQSAQSGAQGRLDAARQLALDAGSLREEDGRTAAHKIREASDAGIPERSRWDKFKDWAADAWHIIVEICKIVVLVLGIVALIIGGPLAWVVFAAALILLADSIMRYMKGECSLWEVGLAALGCIPGSKGLTSLSALRAEFAAGGLMQAGLHVLSSGKAALAEMATAVRAMGSTVRTTMVELGTTIRTTRLLAPLDRGLANLDLAVGADRWFSGAYTDLRVAYHSFRGGEFTAEGNLVARRWTPLDAPGPLGGQDALDRLANPDLPLTDMVHTFRSGTYDQILVTGDTTAYRAVTGGSNLNGPFWAMDPPQGPLQTQLDFALMPEWQSSNVGGVTVTNPQATHFVEATVPSGATVYSGPAGPQTGVTMPGTHLEGGGEQVFIPHMPPHWLTPGVAKVSP